MSQDYEEYMTALMMQGKPIDSFKEEEYDVTMAGHSLKPFVKSTFLQTTSMADYRIYPRSIIGKQIKDNLAVKDAKRL